MGGVDLQSNFTLIGAGMGAQTSKTENFTEFPNINDPDGCKPCTILKKFSGLVGSSSS